MADLMFGSICVSEIPKNLFKKVACKDGKERVYLNLKIVKRKKVGDFGHTHFISVEPMDEKERVDGQNYIVGDLKEYVPKNEAPSPEEIAAAEAAEADDLPF